MIATGAAQAEVQRRTLEWYTQLESEVTSPVAKARVTKRKTELAKSLNVKPIILNPVPSTKPSVEVVGKPVDENDLPIGKSIDLLAMVKLPDHAVLGNWKLLDGAIVSEAFPHSHFMAPVVVTGSYQLTCKFTRRSGREDVSVILPVGETGCILMVDGWDGTVIGLQLVDGRDANQLAGTPQLFVRMDHSSMECRTNSKSPSRSKDRALPFRLPLIVTN